MISNSTSSSSSSLRENRLPSEKSQYTKLTIKLEHEQTSHKRPILFIVPARTTTVLEYAIHGKDKDLFGLKEDAEGLLALYYEKKVTPPASTETNSHPVIHHVRILGLKSRHARHHHEEKELNMKVKIVVGTKR